MNKKSLSVWLCIITAGIILCVLLVYAVVIPSLGVTIAYANPEMSNRFIPWLVFLEITALPVLIALCFVLKISLNIGKDKGMSVSSANMLKYVSFLAAADGVYFFIGNVVLTFMNISHPGVLLFSLMIVFLCSAFAVGSAVLSHFVRNAAALKEESELTI